MADRAHKAAGSRPSSPPVLYIAHDAGGAEVLAALVETGGEPVPALFVGNGPALGVFRRFGHEPIRLPAGRPNDLQAIVEREGVREAFVATGITGYELEALGVLKRLGIRTNAVVEHWVSYRERFGYPDEDWLNNLPDRVLFFDQRAVRLALELGFPPELVELLDNPCHPVLRAGFEARFGCARRVGPLTVLLVAEDLRRSSMEMFDDPDALGFDEFNVVRDVASAVNQLNGPRLLLRPHPNDEPGKYEGLAQELGFAVSDATDLLADLARSDLCVGACTIALVNALVIGRPAVSYVPAGHDTLPEGLDIQDPALRRASTVDGLRLMLERLSLERGDRPPVRVVASIEARTGSSRLPGKVLMDIGGKPALEMMIQRVRAASRLDDVVVATTDLPRDDEVALLCERIGVACYRGDEDDVLNRVVGAVDSVGGDVVVELTGDCVLMDPSIIDACVDAFFEPPEVDYVSNLTPYSWPEGLEVQVFSAAALRWVDDQVRDSAVREHVSLYFYEQPGRYVTRSVVWGDEERHRPEWHLSLDEQADLELLRVVHEALGSHDEIFGAAQVVDYLDSHPDVLALNRSVVVKGART